MRRGRARDHRVAAAREPAFGDGANASRVRTPAFVAGANRGAGVRGPSRDTPEIASLRLGCAHPCAQTLPRGGPHASPSLPNPVGGLVLAVRGASRSATCPAWPAAAGLRRRTIEPADAFREWRRCARALPGPSAHRDVRSRAAGMRFPACPGRALARRRHDWHHRQRGRALHGHPPLVRARRAMV